MYNIPGYQTDFPERKKWVALKESFAVILKVVSEFRIEIKLSWPFDQSDLSINNADLATFA